jgi:hypothetical protein
MKCGFDHSEIGCVSRGDSRGWMDFKNRRVDINKPNATCEAIGQFRFGHLRYLSARPVRSTMNACTKLIFNR